MAIDQVARQLAARALATRAMTAPEAGLELDTTLTEEDAAPDSTAQFQLTSWLSASGKYVLTIRAKAIGYLISKATQLNYERL